MRKILIPILFILLASPFISWSQPYSACFTVDKNRGCSPLTVNVTSCYVGVGTPVYNYDYTNAPNTFTTNTSKTYSTPGIYIIRQAVNDGNPTPTLVYKTDTIEVLGRPTPVFKVLVCQGVVKFQITDTIYDSYLLDYGEGTVVIGGGGMGTYNRTYTSYTPKTISVTGQYTVGTVCTGSTATKTIIPIAALTTPDMIDLTVVNQNATTGSITLRYGGFAERLYRIESKTNNGAYVAIDTITATTNGINSVTITGLNTQSNTYTFRMQNMDMCGTPLSPSSAEVASIILNPTVMNGSNQVVFSSNGGVAFNSLDIYRNSTLLAANAVSPYADNAVDCGTNYCYKIQGTLPAMSTTSGTNVQSYSVSNCVKATYTGTAPVITNINSTVENNVVKVVWTKPVLNPAIPSVSFYTIYRKTNSTYNNYGSSNSNSYLDNNVDVASEPYCYEVSYKDACNNTSAISSASTCTVNLKVTHNNGINNLNWTSYVGYLTGIKEYILENIDENGNVLLSKSVNLANSYSETADQSLVQIIYRIKVVPNGTENLISYSNSVKVDLAPVVYMPTVFTPNGDGDNDILEIKGKYYKSAKITILNRWGEVVFISEDASIGWDGNYKGQPASVDAYSYHVVALDNSGKEITLKGVVSLLR